MRRSTVGLIVALALVTLGAPLPAAAQRPAKVPRIGILNAGAPRNPWFAAFRQGLRDLGYVEGQNILLEERSAEGRLERLPDLAAELVRLRVDLIVAGGGAASPCGQAGDDNDPHRHDE